MAARPGPSVPVLATKLHAPRRRGLVARPRLRARLERRGQPALTLVSAAAGFGKTTLVAEWFAGAPGTAWLSLDRTDDDPAVFWSYVVAALRTARPESIAGARELLEHPHPPIDAVVATLLNDLHALDGELVLVLDDYHVIQSPEIHEGVGFLVDHLPRHVHLVIASRADPPFPLAALRASGELLEIRAADLRFTREEVAAYLDDALDLTLGPDDVERLEARTEGWIAALQLAALSMQRRDDVPAFIAEFAGDDRFILDYLVGEVLDRQSPEIRSFLLGTSILTRLTGSLCDAVTGGSGGRATLERLERANLFLVPLDDRRTWYRYHHLFADVLRAHVLDEQGDRLPELHRRASDWYDTNGDDVEAINHAMAGGHVERAAQLIELAAPAMRRNRREAALRAWLEALPEGVLRHRPVLTLSLVGSRMATGDTADVERLLQVIESAIDDPSTPPIVADVAEFDHLPAQLAVQRAGMALLGGDLDATIAHATSVLERTEPDDHVRRGAASALIGLAHWTTGDLITAERRYDEAVRHLTSAGHLPDMLGCSLALADIQMTRGRLGLAERTLAAGLRSTTEHPGLRGAGDMHVGMAEVLIERHDLDAAARHLDRSAELGDQAGLPQHPYRRRVATARLRAALGDLDGALALLDEAVALYDTDFSPPARPVAALRARVHLAAGDLGAARRWAVDHDVTTGDHLRYVDEYAHITLARTLLAQHASEHDHGALDEAIELSERLLAAAEAGGRTGSVIEILALLACAHRARGDATAAVGTLAEAVRCAASDGYVRTLLDAGPAVPELLQLVVSADDAPPHAHRILASASVDATQGPRSTRPRSGLVDELSTRELEVLRLLRGDLSGPDIARELHVSLNTLRTHTRHIYTKLGVNNRREAMRRATELGL